MRSKPFLAGIVLILLLMVGLFPYLGAHLVVSFTEKAIGKPIEGSIKPVWLKTAFWLKDASFDWEDDFSLMGSEIFVDYHIGELIFSKTLKLSVTGSDVKIQLMGDLFRSFGISHETVRKFDAVIQLDRDGLKEIEKLYIDSDKLKFEIEENL